MKRGERRRTDGGGVGGNDGSWWEKMKRPHELVSHQLNLVSFVSTVKAVRRGGGVRAGRELNRCFRSSTNDYDDDHDGTRI